MLRFAVPLLLAGLAPSARADPVQARYAAYVAGLNIVVLDAAIDISPQRYRLDIAFQTVGAAAAFVSGQARSHVEGAFAAGIPAPTRFTSAGIMRGEQRTIQIDYRAGQPIVSRLEPATDVEREPVPPEQQRGAVDTMSAMAKLIRQVNETGTCDGSVRTFDGRRSATLRAWTVGFEDLPPTRLSTFSGRALHCSFEGRQTGGFDLSQNRERLLRPQRGDAWFAAASPATPMIPVRISFRTRGFGDATMFLAPRE